MEKEENIAKQVRKKTIEYLKSKHKGDINQDTLLAEDMVPANLEKEFKVKYDEFYKNIVQGKKEKKPTDKEVIAELTETLQRTQAEFENYKKREDKEKQEFVKYAKSELVQRLLPTIDTFEIALKSTKDNEKFVKGMEMVYAQLLSTLHSEGLKPIDSIHKKFDPYLHEVMLKEKSDKEDGIIIEELQKGYMLNDKILRHSKVKVSEKVNKKEPNKNKQ